MMSLVDSDPHQDRTENGDVEGEALSMGQSERFTINSKSGSLTYIGIKTLTLLDGRKENTTILFSCHQRPIFHTNKMVVQLDG